MIIFLFIVKMNSSQINQMRFSMDHVADIPPRISSPNYRIYVNTQEEPCLPFSSHATVSTRHKDFYHLGKMSESVCHQLKT